MAPQTRRSVVARGNFQAAEPEKERVLLEIQQLQARRREQERRNNFMKLKPPTFLGGAKHSEAVAWLIKMKEFFNVFGCSDEEKVNYATCRLIGSTNIWWCKQVAQPWTWGNFEKAFCAMYIPDSVQLQMAEDLINLKQKNLTVVQYEAQFSELARLVSPWVDGDEVVAQRFEGGLLVIPFELKAYRDIVRKASLVEKCLLEVERDGYDVQNKRRAIELPQREQDSYDPEGRDSKYLCLQMERDLINLKQNNLTVAEYEAESHRLAAFAPSLVADEAIRAFRFKEGLKPRIELVVVPFELKTFSAVVNKAKLVEREFSRRKVDTDRFESA